MDFGINSLLDLYKRVTPAMNSKRKELMINNIDYIRNEDIWNYLIKNKWSSLKGLTLFDVVSDILNTSNEELDKYKKNSIKNINVETIL